jgi:diacylglycerol kinase family enzyme
LLTVILNRESGSKPSEERLVELFRAEGLDIKIVAFVPERAGEIVRDAVGEGPDAVAVAGGDGTISCVAAELAGGRTPLGILPFGTLNHFAKDLRIPVDAASAVKIIATRHLTRVDLGYVNGRAFINNSSIGIYPDMVEIRRDLRRRGHNKWAALAIAMAKVLDRNAEIVVRLEVDGRRMTIRTPFVFIGNNEYTVEGIHLGGRGRIDAGSLYAYFAHRMQARDLPTLLLRSLLRRARRRGLFGISAAAEIWIETPANHTVPVALDGEVTQLRSPLHYRTAPGALTVIVPR